MAAPDPDLVGEQGQLDPWVERVLDVFSTGTSKEDEEDMSQLSEILQRREERHRGWPVMFSDGSMIDLTDFLPRKPRAGLLELDASLERRASEIPDARIGAATAAFERYFWLYAPTAAGGGPTESAMRYALAAAENQLERDQEEKT